MAMAAALLLSGRSFLMTGIAGIAFAGLMTGMAFATFTARFGLAQSKALDGGPMT